MAQQANQPGVAVVVGVGPGLGAALVRRFARGCAGHLGAGGRVVVLFSEDCDERRILGAFTEMGFWLESHQVTRRLLEDFHVVCFRSRGRE